MRALVMLWLLGGCAADDDACAGLVGTCIGLRVEGALEIDQLRVAVSGGYPAATQTTPPNGPRRQKLPLKVALRLTSPVTGAVDLNLVGLLGGAPVGEASDSITIADGEHRSKTLRLTPPQNPEGDMAVGDLAMEDVDLSVTAEDMKSSADLHASPDLAPTFGSPCVTTGDCAPLNCFVGPNDYPGGFCSKVCNSDAECGNGTICELSPFTGTDKICRTPCATGSDCRPGYVCPPTKGFNDDVPPKPRSACVGKLSVMDCDPAVDGGNCQTTTSNIWPSGLLGGCFRYAQGTGIQGWCIPTCKVGNSTCPMTTLGPGYFQCIGVNLTHFSDNSPTGDPFKGGICAGGFSPHGVDQDCEDTPDGGHFDSQCLAGLECDVKNAVHPTGTNLCKKLCYQNQPPDGGPAVPDGGTVAGGCGGSTCQDVFGLFGTANPIGLCL